MVERTCWPCFPFRPPVFLKFFNHCQDSDGRLSENHSCLACQSPPLREQVFTGSVHNKVVFFFTTRRDVDRLFLSLDRLACSPSFTELNTTRLDTYWSHALVSIPRLWTCLHQTSLNQTNCSLAGLSHSYWFNVDWFLPIEPSNLEFSPDLTPRFCGACFHWIVSPYSALWLFRHWRDCSNPLSWTIFHETVTSLNKQQLASLIFFSFPSLTRWRQVFAVHAHIADRHKHRRAQPNAGQYGRSHFKLRMSIFSSCGQFFSFWASCFCSQCVRHFAFLKRLKGASCVCVWSVCIF